MAGADPLNDLYRREEFDSGEYAPLPSRRRRRDPDYWPRFFRQLDDRRRRRDSDIEAQQAIQNPLPQKADGGFGAFRKAEADMQFQQDMQDPEKRAGWLTRRREALAELEAETEQRTQEALSIPPGSGEAKRVADAVQSTRREIEAEKTRLAEFEAEAAMSDRRRTALSNYMALANEMSSKNLGPLRVAAGDWDFDQWQRMGRVETPAERQSETKMTDIGLRNLLHGMDPAAFTARMQNDEEFARSVLELAEKRAPQIEEALQLARGSEEEAGVIMTILEHTPLMGAFETAMGMASIPAELLGGLLGTEEAQFEDEFTIEDYLKRGNLMSALASMTGYDPDTWLRRRGREMADKVGENLANADYFVKHETGMSPINGLVPVLGISRATGLADLMGEKFGLVGEAGEHATNRFLYKLGFELSVDPLNFVDFGALKGTKLFSAGYKGLKNSEWGKALIELNPQFALAPEKFWLRMEGHAKAAATLGDPKMQTIYLMERAFAESGAGQEALKLVQEARNAEIAAFSKLTPTQRDEALNLLPEVVEDAPTIARLVRGSKDPMAIGRRAAAELATKDDVVREALVAAAKALDDPGFEGLAQKLRSMENAPWANGRPLLEIPALDSDFGYYMTQFDDEWGMWLAKNPDARAAIGMEKNRMSAEAFESAVANWEKSRSDAWRGLTLVEKEERLRKAVRPFGWADDKPIFSRDAFGDVARRAERDARNMKERYLYHAATEVFGTKGDPEVLARIARKAANENDARAFLRALGAEEEVLKRRGALEGVKEGGQALRQATRQAGKEASRVPPGAEDIARVAETPEQALQGLRDAAAAAKETPRAPGQFPVDEARDILSEVASGIANDLAAAPSRTAGTPLSRNVVRGAQGALKRFQEATESATSLAQQRKALTTLKKELRQWAPKALADDYAKRADDALAQLERLESAGALLDPKVRGAAQKVLTAAEKKQARALEKAKNANLDDWSPEVKALWVEKIAKETAPPAPGTMSGLDAYRHANLPLPNSIDDLAQLALTSMDKSEWAKITKYADDFYPHLSDTSAAGRMLDGLRAIFQAAVLARPASLSKDWIGTAIQALFAAQGPEYLKHAKDAAKALGGNPATWGKGFGKGWQASDEVLQLTSEGFLTTKISEVGGAGRAAPEGAGRYFEKAAREYQAKGAPIRETVARVGADIEKRGVAGAVTRSEKVQRATDVMIDARIWFEQVQRYATYRQFRARGMNHREAVDEALKYWGKFDEITKFDRKYLNRGLLFWSWMRATLPISVRNLLDHPVRSKHLLWATAYTHNVAQEQYETAEGVMENYGVPEWFRRMGGWVLGVDNNGNADAVSLGNGSYFAPTVSLLNSDTAKAFAHGDIEEGAVGTIREVLRASPPYIQQIAERIMQRDYFFSEPNEFGQPWRDQSGQSKVRAPSFMYYFMSSPGNDPTAIEEFLDLKRVTDKSGNTRHVVMDPNKSWWLDWIPGLGPLMTDIGSFFDPRMTDTETTLETAPGTQLDLSLKKGLLRQIGLPMYSIGLDEKQEREVRELRAKIKDSVAQLTGGTLRMNEYGQLQPNYSTERGGKMRDDIAQWRQESRALGHGNLETKLYVDQRMIRHYLDEWRVMELDERLEKLQGRAKLSPLPTRSATVPARERFGRLDRDRAEREDRELRQLLGIK